MRFQRLVTWILRLCLLLSSCSVHATDVLTQHNNNARTGAVLDETRLSPAKLNTESFGRLFSFVVNGQIYAQPLVASGLLIEGKGMRNVVYIATMRNWVYAFDADGAEAVPLWQKYLGEPMRYDRIPEDYGARVFKAYNIRPFVGITSTPVIDRARNALYVVAKIAPLGPKCPATGSYAATEACPVTYRIHAMNLANGEIKFTDIRMPPIHTQHGDPAIPQQDVARRHLQRPALLLSNDRVYVAFGAHQDALPYQGWIISFDADTLSQHDAFFCTTTVDGQQGGIWQAGNGPAADKDGNLYIMVGNGSFEGPQEFGSKFVKLSRDLKPVSWFSPANVKKLNDLDIDLGSAGPLLLPDTNELVGGGKQGRLYVLQQNDLGGQQQRHWFHDELNPPVQFFQAARPWRLTWLSWFPLLIHAGYHHIHGSPVYWNSSTMGPTLYVWPEQDQLKAFHYDAATKFNTSPMKGIEAAKGMPGGMLSISANGTADGILWSAMPLDEDAWINIVRGTLRAFDATTLKLLWSTDCNEPDDHFDFAKYVPPTIANGKVYLATFSDRVNVYGPNSSVAGPCQRTTTQVSRRVQQRIHHHKH